MESVVFPASVEEIGEYAFYGNQLQEIMFGNGSRLKTVGCQAFFGNEQLDRENVRFPEGVRVLENVFGRVLGEEHEEVYEEGLDEEPESDGIEE